MKKQQDLRIFLTVRFLILLIVVGCAQMALNAVYHNFVYPMLEKTYALDELMGEATLNATVFSVVSGLLFLLLKQFGAMLPTNLAVYLGSVIRNPLQKDVLEHFMHQTSHMTDTQKKLYVAAFILTILLLIYFWVLPYFLAAVYFGIIVSKKMQEIEEREMEKQRQYERQKNLLLSDVAHDLKTPMTTVAGYARALADQAVPKEKEQEYLEHIYSKTMQMSELLHLLFTYVKLDSEGFELKCRKQDLGEMVRKVVAEQYEELETKNITLSLSLPKEPMMLSLDSLQMERVLTNLIGNALKHNTGQFTLFIELEDREDHICLMIGDSGIPIEGELAEHLFEPFVQGDASRSGNKGSGLGLGIAKKIVEMHGGTIELVQAPKEGMTKAFVITLAKS